eukprot:7453314-Pyramimonas_sp.AAC.1
MGVAEFCPGAQLVAVVPACGLVGDLWAPRALGGCSDASPDARPWVPRGRLVRWAAAKLAPHMLHHIT